MAIVGTFFIFLTIACNIIPFFEGSAQAQHEKTIPDYKVKAGYIYRFLFFIDWPETAFSSSDDSLVIDIIGRDPFDNAFKPVEGKIINGRKLVIKRLPLNAMPETIRRCHILFISDPRKKNVKYLLSILNGHPVLTVSDVPGFAQQGGIINFVMKDDRMGFEINKTSADLSGFIFRSKLLRIASRIITVNNVE